MKGIIFLFSITKQQTNFPLLTSAKVIKYCGCQPQFSLDSLQVKLGVPRYSLDMFSLNKRGYLDLRFLRIVLPLLVRRSIEP